MSMVNLAFILTVGLGQFGVVGEDPLIPVREVDPEVIREHREECLGVAFDKHRMCMANVCHALREYLSPEECFRACDEILLRRVSGCFGHFPSVICEE